MCKQYIKVEVKMMIREAFRDIIDIIEDLPYYITTGILGVIITLVIISPLLWIILR